VKRLLKIFELTKNEQRVVLIVILILLAGAFTGYQRRVHRVPVQQPSATEAERSPTPMEAENDQ
jgi:hypothetical protein